VIDGVEFVLDGFVEQVAPSVCSRLPTHIPKITGRELPFQLLNVINICNVCLAIVLTSTFNKDGSLKILLKPCEYFALAAAAARSIFMLWATTL
jgi:hypothetical protein